MSRTYNDKMSAEDHLKTLIMMAWAAGCCWLTLDADAEEINGLPTFD